MRFRNQFQTLLVYGEGKRGGGDFSFKLMGKVYCFYVVFLLDLKKNCWLFKMFFYMSLAMCNSRIVCDVICRHFFTFLPISIPGYWEIRCCWFFSTISMSCAQNKVWKKCEDLKHFVQRENIESNRSMLLLMLLFCN